jgi:hypothetical protein
MGVLPAAVTLLSEIPALPAHAPAEFPTKIALFRKAGVLR